MTTDTPTDYASLIERLEKAEGALIRIAVGRFRNASGNSQRLVRDHMINIARRTVPDWQARLHALAARTTSND